MSLAHPHLRLLACNDAEKNSQLLYAHDYGLVTLAKTVAPAAVPSWISRLRQFQSLNLI